MYEHDKNFPYQSREQNILLKYRLFNYKKRKAASLNDKKNLSAG